MPEDQLEEDEEVKKPLLPPKFGRKALFFLAPVFVIIAGMAGYGHYTDPGPLPENKVFVVPHGSNLTVVEALQGAGIVSPTWTSRVFFRGAAFITHKEGSIHAAEFQFPAHVSMAHVLEILRHGKPISHQLTIPEGITSKKIVDIINNAPFLSGKLTEIQEGTVFPQTLAYVLGTPRQSIVERLHSIMEKNLNDAWNKRDMLALDGLVQTPQDLLIIASLIEKETALPNERPRVARVFLNRLKLGMRLQTDPTVIYGLSDGSGVLDHPLTHADLMTPNPYNTYLETGLPPGPICAPSKSSLFAAAHPADGKELYFVANGNGGHNFSENLKEQNNNIRAYHHKVLSSGSH
ncbi:endolytic transglycosylase MltG [Swingsia samuiensis]|uniref:Endolytic murein transglycosylase n=1 Tax=Swingsia samuiensis TaxID=1293412 RepID=A0A4Y6UMT3_9PROT|nr:endolytic transglycosylase MltG [Swingsia samuiensis]QDH17706.1 endolytic transglycosylase MltG [Swingsia samuiensis]